MIQESTDLSRITNELARCFLAAWASAAPFQPFSKEPFDSGLIVVSPTFLVVYAFANSACLSPNETAAGESLFTRIGQRKRIYSDYKEQVKLLPFYLEFQPGRAQAQAEKFCGANIVRVFFFMIPVK